MCHAVNVNARVKISVSHRTWHLPFRVHRLVGNVDVVDDAQLIVLVNALRHSVIVIVRVGRPNAINRERRESHSKLQTRLKREKREERKKRREKYRPDMVNKQLLLQMQVVSSTFDWFVALFVLRFCSVTCFSSLMSNCSKNTFESFRRMTL